ncbi:MAG: Gfo/Idh/MocA family oxidoreductase, partial [Planctomycetes bacterium]|nr:Gfo/Idh/MocA family oxidoreductase [Planctomycetota bacterium]
MKNLQGNGWSRRELVGAAAAVAAFTFVPKRVLGEAGQPSANNKLNIAGIGVGGQGGGNMNALGGENIVALCDVDDERAAGTFNKFPNARKHKDFRRMLDKEHKNIDAVMIATPDHCHAPAAIRAMRLGKHVYCEKPMAHTIYESRRMTEVARQMKVVTQMGQGGHA